MASRVLRTGGLWFNGKNNYVEMLNPIAGGEHFTFMAWLYRTKDSIYDADNNWITGNKTPNFSWYSSIYDNVVRVWYYGSGWVGNVLLPKYEWHHIAVVIDGASGVANNLKIYKDGVLNFQGTITYALSATTSKPWVGGREDIARYFGGLIDEVRIYNRALSAGEVSEIYSKGTLIKDGLVLCLPFHEGEGSIVHDVSGYNNHGTLYGDPMWVVKKALVR